MKIDASLVPVPGNTAFALALVFSVLSLFAILAALFVGTQGLILRSERAELEARYEKAKQSAAKVTEAALPPRAELVVLRDRVAALNGITGMGASSLTSILARLEGALPDEMALTTLRYRRREAEIHLLGETGRADQLTNAMQKLERDAGFRDLRLLRQGEGNGGRAGIQFEMTLRDTP